MIKIYILFFVFSSFILHGQVHSISFTPLPEGINTTADEELGRWSIDGRSLIFTRMAEKKANFFIARFDSLGKLSTVEKMPFDSTYSGGGHTISPDGKYLVFTLCNKPDGLGGCDLYESQWKNGAWSWPLNMGPAINLSGWESQPVFGLDGLSIYFASTRPGGYGGSDIWITHQLSPGLWSLPINAGPGINTADNEGSPFIHFDGRTMYFMRDGKGGFGGYDLYISHMGIDGQWMKSENMGGTINSAADEGGLALYPDGKRAIITRSTPDRRNDLFEFLLPVSFQSVPVQALYVTVTDEQTNQPVRAKLELFDINKRDTIRTSQWADENGNITVTIDRNKPYGIVASAVGYILHSSNLSAEQGAMRREHIEMIPIASSFEKTIALQNIFFETNAFALLPSYQPELNILVQNLQDNPGMKIEIRGHTDDVGSKEDNQRLSEARAKSVYQYLIDRGIDAGRLSYKGFGETQPVSGNKTEAGRRQNRRTEFVILKI